MKRRILVTGATGQIGSELTTVLRGKHGDDNIFAAGHKRKPTDILRAGPFGVIDTLDKQALSKVVDEFDVDTIYHLAALLSVVGEQNPELAWNVNMDGLKNVLELAKERRDLKVFWPSSIAVFGPDAGRVNTPQNTIMTPTTIYGVTKVAGELLCNYYSAKFGVDVRSVRYPGIISSETPPGGGTTDYAVEIFYEAIKKKRYVCFLRPDTILPMMYMPDCLRATIEIMEADSSLLKTRMSYNVAAVSFAAEELTQEIKKHIPQFNCEYKPDFRQKIADSWPMSIDDSAARKDWGWLPKFSLASMTEDMLSKLNRKYEAGTLP